MSYGNSKGPGAGGSGGFDSGSKPGAGIGSNKGARIKSTSGGKMSGENWQNNPEGGPRAKDKHTGFGSDY